MFIITYYDEKNCLITPIGKPFFELEKGQKLMENTVLQHLKKIGCENPEKLLQEAKKEKGFHLDPDNDIELYAEPCIIYIKTESEEPFFLYFSNCKSGYKSVFLYFSRSKKEKYPNGIYPYNF